MTFTATTELDDAMLQGIADRLDAHPTNHAYAVLMDAAAVPLVTMVFARPAASIIDHTLRFAQNDLTGDFIETQGSAASFQLFNGEGALMGSGDVSDMAGNGALKVSGTTGTVLFAGARAILGQLKFV